MIFTQNLKHKSVRLKEIAELLSDKFYFYNSELYNGLDKYLELYTLDKPDKFLWFKRRRFLGRLSIELYEQQSIIYVCTTSVEFGDQINKILTSKYKNVLVSVQDEMYVSIHGFFKPTDEMIEEFKEKKEKNAN